MKFAFAVCVSVVLIFAVTTKASEDTIGPDGIDSAGLIGFDGETLTGGGVAIGQVELNRPGRPGTDHMATSYNLVVQPTAVFFRTSNTNFTPNPDSIKNPMTNPQGDIDTHPEEVAGVMISNAGGSEIDPSIPTGVALGASLFSAGFNPASGSDVNVDAELMMELIADQTIPGQANNAHVKAINMSFTNTSGATSAESAAFASKSTVCRPTSIFLAILPPKIALSDALRDIKANSSKWMHETKSELAHFGWQDGYAAFTVSRSQVDSARASTSAIKRVIAQGATSRPN